MSEIREHGGVAEGASDPREVCAVCGDHFEDHTAEDLDACSMTVDELRAHLTGST